MSTPCPTDEVLDRYVQGRLFEFELKLIHEHVETCVRCTEYLTRSRGGSSAASGTPLSSTAEAAVRTTPQGGAALAVSRGMSLGGRYVVIDPVGRGGMGVVYSAYDDRLNKKVAVKLLRSDRVSEQLSRALREEAKVLARLDHPNVVTAHDVGTFLDQVFIAMEFVDGGTLTRWLKEKPRSWQEVLAMFLGAGEGLAAVHQAGLVHRDFKTDNVLLDKDGKPHVTDFGLAAELGPDGAELGGRRVGTPGYRSPEQERRERADALSDQFSFCAALYEALYGELPYGPREDSARPLGAVRAPPQGKAVPGWLRKVLLRGLSPIPGDRYPSIPALLAALRDDPARKLKSRLTAAALLASALTVAGVLGWLVTRETSAERARRECLERASAQVASMWNAARQAEIERALTGAAGQPTWAQVSQRLGAAVQSWSAVQAQTCALPERDPARPLVLDCLEGHRAVLQSMSDLFTSADRVVAENALSTIFFEVRPAETCRVTAPPSPARVQDTAQAAALRGALAKARVFRSAGKFDEAITEGNRVVREAEEAGDARVQAEARLLVGGLFADLRQYPAEAVLRQAAINADAVGDVELRARAKIALVGVYTNHRRFEEAHWAADAAAASVAYIGKPPLLEAALLSQQGKLAARKGEQEEALQFHTRALELRKAVLPPDDPQVLNAVLAVGSSQPGPQGAELIQSVIDTRSRLFGADHPETAIAWFNLGTMWRQVDDCGRALEAFEREWAIRRKAAESDLARAGRVQTRIASSLICLERDAEAWPLQQAGVRMLEQGNALPSELRHELGVLSDLCGALNRPAAECGELRKRLAELEDELRAQGDL